MAMLRGLRLATGAAVACGVLVLALTAATAESAKPCDVMEPDSLGISWTAPCDEGRWLHDPQSGCRMWDWHPAPDDTSTWTGACPAGRKEGRGVVQWFEHGRPIDRFEGVYRRGKREGFGRYDWPTGDRFEGTYADDLPTDLALRRSTGVVQRQLASRLSGIGRQAHRNRRFARHVRQGQ